MAKHLCSLISLISFLVLIELASTQYNIPRPYWSLCSGGIGNDDCFNGYSRDTGTVIAPRRVQSVSVKGMWQFFVSGRGANETGLAEFIYQEQFGDYKLLSPETIGNITSARGFADMDGNGTYINTVAVFNKIEFLTDGVSYLTNTTGSLTNCWSYGSGSLAIVGSEPWELYRQDGASICIVNANRTSGIPGLVRDVTILGFVHDEICVFAPGCTQSQMYAIDNSVTRGILRRPA